MFLDDIADTVKDAASTVGKAGLEVAGLALSPMQSITMKGLGAAMSTVTEVFGNVDLFDSVAQGNLPTEFLDGAASLSGKVLGDNGAAGGFAADIAKVFTGGDVKAGAALTDGIFGDGGQSAKFAGGIANMFNGNFADTAASLSGEVLGDDGEAAGTVAGIANMFTGDGLSTASALGGKLMGQDNETFQILTGVANIFSGKDSPIALGAKMGDPEFGNEVEQFLGNESINKRINPGSVSEIPPEDEDTKNVGKVANMNRMANMGNAKVNRAMSRFM